MKLWGFRENIRSAFVIILASSYASAQDSFKLSEELHRAAVSRDYEAVKSLLAAGALTGQAPKPSSLDLKNPQSLDLAGMIKFINRIEKQSTESLTEAFYSDVMRGKNCAQAEYYKKYLREKEFKQTLDNLIIQ